MKLLSLVALLLTTHLTKAAEEPAYIVFNGRPSIQYRVEAAGRNGIAQGEMAFAATTTMSLPHVAVTIISDQPRPAAAFINQRLYLFELEGDAAMGEVFFINADANKGIAVFNPPLKLESGKIRTFVVVGDLAAQDANTWERRGMFIALEYDGTSPENYATLPSGARITGPKSSTQIGAGMRIFRTVPWFWTTAGSTAARAGETALTVEVTNPSAFHDLGLKKLTFRVTTRLVREARFSLRADGVRVNSVAAGMTNGIVEIWFDSESTAKIVPGDSKKKYQLVPETIIRDDAFPLDPPFLSAELLPDTATSPKVVGTVAEIEAGPENTDNIIWTPFTATSPRANAESENWPDWTNGYGILGTPFLDAGSLPKLAGISVTKDGYAKLEVWIKVPGYSPPYLIESSTDLMNWKLIGDGRFTTDFGGVNHPEGRWATFHLYRADGAATFYRLIHQ